MNLRKELEKSLRDEVYDLTEEGIFFPRQGIRATGEYFDRINGGEWMRTRNLIVDEGLAKLLNISLGNQPKPAGYYLALFSGSASPAPNWTAANFATVASEIVSMTEGYTSPTRPEWVPDDTSSNSIDNMNGVARLTIATTSQLNVTGAALLTSNVRGGTTGTLISATKYAAARVFQDGDTYDVGYRLSLTV